MNCVTIPVKGMNMNAIAKALKGVQGVSGVDIDLWQNIATVTYDETMADEQHLRQVVNHTIHHS
ncbi:heavy-metal-associated domain-containing protein [Fodinisporobacter ferrooxydans]|uniref:Heavy-metal-associated domain-containing protein n=1 Tax=Fodinisporobacter ferrooxydans TaxID=2901836 RepID=A0ABY4CJC5_9BACL|nr:heavy-metal-associated domain-containing protein [Alicyclobacillaceae bacterium MYW30-H2]